MRYVVKCWTPIDLLTPKSDWLLISPYNITFESNIFVYESKGNDHHFRKLLIVKRILLVSSIGNVKRTVQRISMLGE